MAPIVTTSRVVVAEPLSPAAFAAFGDVAERPIDVRRRYLPTSADAASDIAHFAHWISSAAKLGALPLRIVTLERHPYTAQTFVPLGSSQYLAIVCASDSDGQPDLASLRCFIAGGHQSITFARNVWHHPMTVLGEKMEFAVAMGMTGRDDDDVFVDVTAEIEAVMPRSA